MNATNDVTKQWRILYRVASVAAILIVVVGLVDTITSMLGGETRTTLEIGVVEWFDMFANEPFKAFSLLGIINITTVTLSIPLYISLKQVLKTRQPVLATVAFVCFVVGAGVYFSTNSVFSMFALSRQYLVALESQKALLEAAGTAVLALGADLTPATVIGLVFIQLGGLAMVAAAARIDFVRAWIGWIGALAYLLMVVFFVVTAFAPQLFNLTMPLSMLAGVLLMGYHILIAIKLFRIQ
jgi:hypothetical protein